MKQVLRVLAVVLVAALFFQFGCKDSGTNPELSQWQSLGLEGKLVSNLVFIGDYLYATAGRDGLYRINRKLSDAQWEYLGLADTAVGRALDEGVTGVIVVGSNLLVSYRASDYLRKHGIYRSTDNGATWLPSDSGMYRSSIYTVTSRVHSLASSPQSSNVVFANLSAAIYKSTDAGYSWQLVDENPEASSHIYVFRFNPNNPNEIWAGEESGRFAPYLRYSIDQGETWSPRVFPPNIGPYTYDNAVYDIAIGPANDSIVYFGMLGVIVKTTDKAQTFQRILGWEDGIYRHWRLAINPSNPQELLATGFYLYRTTDGGKSWQRITPPDNRNNLYALAVNWQQRVLFVSTSSPGNGIYKLFF